MSGNINQSFELKQCNNEKKKYSNAVYCNSKSKDSSSDTNQSQSSSLQSDSRFPSPPRLCKNVNKYFNSDSDSSDSDKCCTIDRNRLKKKKLPPIGVFWDIENCQVPKGRSAVSVARLIRDLFFTGYREAEFVVVCDVKKESSQIVQELNDAQVTLIHVASTCKNAADEKLRQALRRYAETYEAPAAVILISGDINFAADLSDLRHRKKLHVILIHKENAADALILCASEHYNYTNITQALPLKETKPLNGAMEVIVRNLPKSYDPVRLKNRLKQLSDNCGGRVVFVSLEIGTAVVRFINLDAAVRAQRRMDGEDVYGNKISVSYPNTVRNWEKTYSPYKIPARKISKNNSEMFLHPSLYSLPPPPNVEPQKNSQEYLFNPLDQFQTKQYNVQKAPGYNSEASKNLRAIHGTHGGPPYSDPEPWRPHSASFTEGKRNEQKTWMRNISGSFTALNTMDFEDENLLQSNNSLLHSNSITNSTSISSPVDLTVTNLDQNIDTQDLKTLLLSMFQECAMVVSLSLFHQVDGNLAANVKVSNQQDAQYVISQLHRRKIGHKRIIISHSQNNSNANPQMLRTLVISLLQEVPGNKMPLFKFRELLETRYRMSVPVSELYKLRDICAINEDLGGRMIALSLDLRTTPSPHSSHSGLEIAHCLIHCPNGSSERGWAEADLPSLPNVRFKLKVFSAKVHELLHSHMGFLPLLSFPMCYEFENGEKLPVDETGVPLEHLVTCVAGVELRMSSNSVKYLIWGSQVSEESKEEAKVSPPLATQLALFSRELVDLLKTSPRCELPFSRFIPAYHHHFGRQCRVADYGHTKLIDLLAGLTDVVQVIGEGNRRALTLAHGAQLRRFTSDLLRLLKAQASKHLHKADFTHAYQRLFSRPFDPCDYGLCHLQDLLELLDSQAAVHITHTLIAIPKREQTAQEVLKTKQFTLEVVDLLKHAPQYGILFNKFVPAYHHHFGHQCRVADYGFAKLIDLFEAIPDIVKIEEMSDGERKVCLTAHQALKVVRQQLIFLIENSKLQSIPYVALSSTFLREFGYNLRPELYGCSSIEDLIEKCSNSLQLVSSPAGPLLILFKDDQLSIKIWSIFINSHKCLKLCDFVNLFYKKFNFSCTLQQIEKYPNIFQVKHINKSTEISLTPLYSLAVRLYKLLFENSGNILLGNLDGMYLKKFGHILRPSDYGIHNLNTLLNQFSFLVRVRGRKNNKQLSLNLNIANHGVAVPPGMKEAPGEDIALEEDVQWPPPPAHTYLFNSSRTTSSPPKPDTPPSRGASHWDNSMWTPSVNFTTSLNLCIPLPFAQTPSLLDNPYTLLSPMKNLLPAFSGEIHPPDPCELPMPSVELLNKSKTASPSKDSGISSTSFSNSVEEPDSSTNYEAENTTPKKKRHSRLAAHFTTPLNLT